jgi:hypothetical protein
MRAAIAAAMARSKREIPHYYMEHQVDVTGCEEFLSRINAGRPPDNRLLMGALLVKSVAFAARRVPVFNGFHQNGEFKPSPRIHTGVAIAIRGGGLAAPAIHDSDQLTVDELMVRMRDLVQRVRAGRIRSSEMADPTITVSSLGERGVEALYGIIYPPQVAIVGFGKIVARPWIVDGSVVARSVVTITLAADHRASDGHVEDMPPFMVGGQMIRRVSADAAEFADPPRRFEAGTPPIGSAVGLGAAIRWMERLDWDVVAEHERRLTGRLLDALASLKRIRVVGPVTVEQRRGVALRLPASNSAIGRAVSDPPPAAFDSFAARSSSRA